MSDAMQRVEYPEDRGWYWYRGPTTGLANSSTRREYFEGVVYVEYGSGASSDDLTADFNKHGGIVYIDIVEFMTGEWYGPVTLPWEDE